MRGTEKDKEIIQHSTMDKNRHHFLLQGHKWRIVFTLLKSFFFPKLRTFHMTYMKSIRHSYFWHVHIKFYWDTSKLIHLCMYYVCLAISDYVESWEVMARFYSQNPMWVVTWTFIKPKEKKKKKAAELCPRERTAHCYQTVLFKYPCHVLGVPAPI